MSLPPRARTLAGAALLLLTTAACGTSAASAPAAPAAASSSTAPSPAAPTTAPPTPSAAPSPAAPRTQAQLEQALLTLDDLPSGYAIDRADAEEDGTAEVTTDDPACAALAQVMNSATPGTLATTGAYYDGGLDAASFDAGLDALPTADAALASVETQRAAVQACDEVTVEIPEEGPVIFEVLEISVPELGDARLGVRMTALGDEEIAGFELLTIVAAVDDVLARGTFFDAYVEDAEGIMELAVDKIDQGSGGSTT